MTEKNIKSRIVHKHDLEANWALASNFIPKQGELIVYDIDDNYDYERFKIGDGKTVVSSLPFSTEAKVSKAEHADSATKAINDADDNEIQRVYCAMVPYGTSIGDNKDLNTVEFLKVDNYCCNTNERTATLLNCPVSEAFMMHVFSPLSTAIDDENDRPWVYRVRKIMSLSGNEYTQEVRSNETTGVFTYGEWKKDLKEDDVDSDLSETSTNAVQNMVVTSAINDLKDLVGDTPIADQITAALDERIVQHDWSENDETNSAYIKNRTHWIEENIVEAVPETTLASNGYIYGSILSISSGTRCIVTWEGTEYVCVARRDPNGMYKALIGDMTGNEPFELSIYMSGYVGPPGLCAKVKSSDGVVEGKIISIKIDKSVVHKLDTRYLPDNLAYMPKKSSVFLSSADWTGEGNLWSQPVIITAATATSKIDLLPTASQIVSLQSEEISLMIENDNGELTAYAIGGRPSTFYTMDVLLTEVVLV